MIDMCNGYTLTLSAVVQLNNQSAEYVFCSTKRLVCSWDGSVTNNFFGSARP